MQQLAEAIGPSVRETRKLSDNYHSLKERLDEEYEQLADIRRSQQQDIVELQRLNAKSAQYGFQSGAHVQFL